MKNATSLIHNIEQIVEEVKKDIPIIEKVIEQIVEEVKIIEKVVENVIEEVKKDIPIIENVVENVVEKIIDVIPVIEKDIATVEKIIDVSIETDTIVEQEPVSSEQIYESSSDKLDLELIYPDYDDEILDDIPDDCPPIKKPPSFYKKPSSFKK